MGNRNSTVDSLTPPGNDEMLFGKIYKHRKGLITVPGPEDFTTLMADLVQLSQDDTPSVALCTRVEKILYDLGIFMQTVTKQYEQAEGDSMRNLSADDISAGTMYIVLAELDTAKRAGSETVSFDDNCVEQSRVKILDLADSCSKMVVHGSKMVSKAKGDSYYLHTVINSTVATVSAFKHWSDHDEMSAFQVYQDSLAEESLDRLEIARAAYKKFQSSRELHSKDVYAEEGMKASKLVERSIERFCNPKESKLLDKLREDVEKIGKGLDELIEGGQFDLSADNKDKKQFLDDMGQILNDKQLSYEERQTKLQDHVVNSPESVKKTEVPVAKDVGYYCILAVKRLFSGFSSIQKLCVNFLQKYQYDYGVGKQNGLFCASVKEIASLQESPKAVDSSVDNKADKSPGADAAEAVETITPGP